MEFVRPWIDGYDNAGNILTYGDKYLFVNPETGTIGCDVFKKNDPRKNLTLLRLPDNTWGSLNAAISVLDHGVIAANSSLNGQPITMQRLQDGQVQVATSRQEQDQVTRVIKKFELGQTAQL